MGIRFQCHECSHGLNVKTFLAGKKGTCPKCGLKFRIPPADQEFSIPLTSKAAGSQGASTAPEREAQDSAVAVASQPLEEKEAKPQPDTVDALSPLANKDIVWYVRPPSGGQFGPAESDLMQQWITESRVVPGALVWRDGWPQWRLAEEVFPEHFNQVSSAASVDVDLESDLPGSIGAIELPKQKPSPLSDSPKSGDADIGSRKRGRRRKQTTMIAILTTVSLLLVGTLIVVVILTSGTKPTTQ